MNKTQLLTTMSRTIRRTGFRIKKHSPEILMISGAIGMVASAVMACKATTKLEEVLEKHNQTTEKIRACMNDEKMNEAEYTKEDGKKDLVITYVHTGIDLVKLYGPSVALGLFSMTSMLASNGILQKRNAGLAAAYAAASNSFKEYRGNVVKRFGEQIDKELKYNLVTETIEETYTDEKGKEHKSQKFLNVIDEENIHNEYARVFKKGNPNWERNHDYNMMFLRARETILNDILRRDGILTLNTVYQELGFEPTKAGMVVGWIYDEKNPVGDNYVDLGIQELYEKTENDGITDYNPAILLDFNVDGNIYKLL